MSISVVVVAKNSEKTILQTLGSVQFAEEVILVDIKSTDQTKKLAQKYCTKILEYPKDSRFVEPVRNYALSQAKKEWILILDADEEIPAILAKKLQEIDQKDLGDLYYLPRKNMVMGDWLQHTGWWPDHQLRFFKNGLVSWSEKIHAKPIIKENFQPSYLEANKDLAILHHNYSNATEYIDRLNRYTDIEALQKKDKDFNISSASLLKSFSSDLFSRFFANNGYKDGVRGLYLSVMQAAYQMTVQMKIFNQLGNKKELETNDLKPLIKELKSFQRDLNYWIIDMEIKEKTGIDKLFAILKRKFRL